MSTTRDRFVFPVTGAGLISSVSNMDPDHTKLFDHVKNGISPNKTYKVERIIYSKTCRLLGTKKTIIENTIFWKKFNYDK